ncbi:hypothetical protein CD351_05735 [Erythrobacter sp. KY5]|uniref:hypothetical protein n=1 Tax=Erythrobacter sp. KY5 TaxID=2011159 RepID=UPI000DBF298D|nr:hypothetical protein [Erythrobacter sp. KY5]AWW73924.1 hypothetical protein CD351_05735 [Erythrobacter sp. KY5]
MAFSTKQTPSAPRHLLFCASAVLAVCAAIPASAQDGGGEGSGDYVDRLKACQIITEDAARLACFDSAVGGIVAATETGEVQVVDREDVRETRRSLFGFSLPNIGIFGGDEEEDELFETTIESVRYFGSGQVRFTTTEGAVWEMNNVPRRQREIKAGDNVVFKDAALGTYFVRINGQRGVKGRRVQ